VFSITTTIKRLEEKLTSEEKIIRIDLQKAASDFDVQ